MSITAPALFYMPPPPQVLCRLCGATLNGKIHRDTAAGPECSVPCVPRAFQLTLPQGAKP